MTVSVNSAIERRPDLGLVVEETFNALEGFVATTLLPVVKTKEQAVQFPVLPASILMEDGSVDGADLTDTHFARKSDRGYHRVDGFEYGRGVAACTELGVETVIDAVEIELAEQEIAGMEMKAAERLAAMFMRKIERDAIAKVQGIAGATVTSTGNIMDDVEEMKIALESTSACDSMAMILPMASFRAIKRDPVIIDMLKATYPGIMLNNLGISQLETIFDCKIIVPKGRVMKNGKLEYMFTGGPTLVNLNDLGRTYVWTRDSETLCTVEKYSEPWARRDVVRCRSYVGYGLMKSDTYDLAARSKVTLVQA